MLPELRKALVRETVALWLALVLPRACRSIYGAICSCQPHPHIPSRGSNLLPFTIIPHFMSHSLSMIDRHAGILLLTTLSLTWPAIAHSQPGTIWNTPGQPTQDNDFASNEVWEVESTQDLQWATDLSSYNVDIYQQNYTTGSLSEPMRIHCKLSQILKKKKKS